MEVNFLVLILINSPGLMTISWADVLVINIPLIWVNFLGNISVPLPIKVPCFALNFSSETVPLILYVSSAIQYKDPEKNFPAPFLFLVSLS